MKIAKRITEKLIRQQVDINEISQGSFVGFAFYDTKV